MRRNQSSLHGTPYRPGAPRSTSRQPLRAIAIAVLAAMASLSAPQAQAAQRSDNTVARPAQDNGFALVQLLG